MSLLAYYGGKDLSLGSVDIRQSESYSIDLRAESGGNTPDETRVVPPGVFISSVCPPLPADLPIGEIRIILGGREVSIVGALTGREGVTEITVEHLTAAERDPRYRDDLLRWLGVSA